MCYHCRLARAVVSGDVEFVIFSSLLLFFIFVIVFLLPILKLHTCRSVMIFTRVWAVSMVSSKI